MESLWRRREDPPSEAVACLVSQFSLPAVVARFLCQRGITTLDACSRFLEPSLEHLHDPFLLSGMDRAVDRIASAIANGERIGLFGDFDVDGIAGTSLLFRFFRQLGVECHCRLPNRLSEGYGLSRSAVDSFGAQEVTLLITVDCGITAGEEVDYAQAHRIDCIITDHHQPQEELPRAWAVVDPKRHDCDYPFKELAGVGLAWKLADAVAERLGEDKRMLLEDLDLVAVGSIADVSSLRGENRILVRFGIDQLTRTTKNGFRHLLDVAGLGARPLGYGSIAFGLAPRLNAAGRLGDAWPAFELLTTYSDTVARQRALELHRINRERQALDARISEEAMSHLEHDTDPGGIVLASEDWHPGVVGIAASRVRERFGRPAVLIALKDGIGKGSARSVPGFPLHLALERCGDLLERAGGHALAAGLVIREEKISRFRERFQELFQEAPDAVKQSGGLTFDAEIPLKECDWGLLGAIERMSPFGPGNERPILLTRGVSAPTGFRKVGKDHVKFLVSQEGVALDAIAFQAGHEKAHEWAQIGRLDVAFTFEENRWGGERRLQLNIKGVRQAETDG